MKLIEYIHLTGKIVVETGLHIGGSKESTQIGGMDNPIIRQPKDNFPYIPGSSLKGKMRSLLELHLDKVPKDGKPHSYKEDTCKTDCVICRIFGASGLEKAKEEAEIGPGPARIIVRDCLVDKEDPGVKKLLPERGVPLSEEKAETAINRIKGAALQNSLRKTERVPAGAVFNLDITFRVLEESDKELFETVLKGLALVQKDGLGGSISRGYGKIRFDNLLKNGEEIELPEV